MQSAREEFGPLKDAIDNAGKKIATDCDEETAFSSMTENIKSENLARAVDLIIQGTHSGGQLAGILDGISDIFRDRSLLSKEMRSSVLMYAIFIFFAVGFGAPVLFGISDYMVNTVMGGIETSIPDMSGEVTLVGTYLPVQSSESGVDPGFMRMYFLLALSISSTTGSIVLGQILGGNEKGGIKFIPVLILLSLVLFFVVEFMLSMVLGSMLA